MATEDFHFKVLHVFAGVGSVVVYDAAAFGLRACEVFDFDAEGKVRKATAHYGRG